MKIKRILLMFLLAFSITTLNAQDRALVILKKNGSKTVYLLKNNPVVNFIGDNIVIKYIDTKDSFRFDSIDSFSYLSDFSSSEITLLDSASPVSINIEKNYVVIKSASDDKVHIFNSAGKKVISAIVTSGNDVVINMQQFEKGVYIIVVSNHSVKFING